MAQICNIANLDYEGLKQRKIVSLRARSDNDPGNNQPIDKYAMRIGEKNVG